MLNTESAQATREDALAYLPCSAIQEYKKGDNIYDAAHISRNLFLVIDGRVKLSRVGPNRELVVIDIYHTDDFFGEAAFLDLSENQEQVVALEATKVMTWTAEEIEEIIMRQPRLAVALMQVLVQRTQDFKYRLESFSAEGTPQRLARSLMHFGERFGSQMEGGSVTIPPLTHELLAQYVGTSREIVTHYMSDFRQKGYLRYSRRGITLHSDGLRQWLHSYWKVA